MKVLKDKTRKVNLDHITKGFVGRLRSLEIVWKTWVVYNKGNDRNRGIIFECSCNKRVKTAPEISDQRWENEKEVH